MTFERLTHQDGGAAATSARVTTSARAAVFYDGRSNHRHAVTLRQITAIEIYEDERFLAAWACPEVRRADGPDGILRLRNVSADPLARLEIGDPALQAEMMAACPLLDGAAGEAEISTRRIFAWSFAAAASILAVVWFGMPLVADRLAAIVPVAVEKRIGDIAAAQIAKTFGRKTCTNTDGVAALNKLMATLQTKADLQLPLQASALDSSVPNAFALSGGRVYVLRGMIDKAASPDEVAGVVAHELGHVAHRDGLRRLIQQGGTSFLLGLLFGDVTGASIMVDAGRQAIYSAYSRETESRADLYARDLMVKLGRSPRPLGELLARMEGSDKANPLAIFASHPLTIDRLAALAKAEVGAEGSQLLTPVEWAAFKRICE